LEPGTAVRLVFGLETEIQVVDAFEGLAITIPAGKTSVKSRFPTLEAFNILSIVKVNVDVPPKLTELGEKDFEKPGKEELTVKFALDPPLVPADEVSSPETFIWTPALDEVTFTVMAQELNPATEPPLYVIVPPPSGAVSVPPLQFVEAIAGSAIVTPAGSTSVKSNIVTPEALPVLSMLNVSVLTLPGPIVAGENDFEKPG